MSVYFLSMMLLSAGSFIHSRCEAPEMRPDSAGADMTWRWVARAALVMWIALIIWGFRELHWSQPLAGIMASLGVNALVAMRGPMRTWPGLSLMLCATGLVAGSTVFF